ncbi:MAG: cytochrome b/b6 domain-containing protein [Pseudomonadota bacterium]
MALQEELKDQGDFLFRRRSHLPLLLVATGLWVKVYQERFNGLASEGLTGELLEGSALLVGLLGLAIRVWTVGFSAENTSGRNTGAGQVADVLNTTGAYSMTRNPLYLGNYFMWIAVAMVTGNIWFVATFTLVFWVYYERIVFAEEAFLREKFGAAYLDWAARTPAFFPEIRGYVAAGTPFNLRKVLRQEKNGLFALLFLLCLFGLVGDLAEGEFSLEEERLSIIAAALAATAYVILRYLKKRTSLLSDTPANRVVAVERAASHSLLAKVFHWGFIAVFAYGIVKRIDEVEELESMALLLHETAFAFLFLAILFARFLYMRSTRASALPDSTPDIVRRSARLVHLGLYASLAMIAFSGLMIGAAYASGVKGGPALGFLIWLHEACLWTSLILIAIHVAGALYHRWLRDGVWNSMVPVFRERPDRRR